MRLLRRSLQVVLLALTIIVGVSAGAVIVTQTAWFRDWLRGLIVRQGNQYLNGRLTIGRLGGNIFFGIELEDVAVTMNGEPVITLKDARIAYSVLQLMTKNLVITSLRLNEPVVHMRRDGRAWELSELVKKQASESKRTGPGLPVQVDDIEITAGSFDFADRPVGTTGVDVPEVLNRLDARMSFAYEPVHYTIDISKISFRGQSPQFALNQMSGKVAVAGDSLYLNKVAIRTAASDLKVDGAVYHYTKTPSLDVHVTSDKLDLDEVARIVPPLGRIDLKPALDVIAKGPLSNLAVHFDVKSRAAGEASGDVVLDMTAPDRRISGTVHTRDVNVGAIVRRPAQATAITGVTRFDLRLLNGRTGTLPVRATYSVQAQIATAFGYLARDLNAHGTVNGNRVAVNATALAYGARTRAVGTIDVPYGRSPLGFDLRGSAADADLRRLPPQLKVPRPATRLNLDFHVSGAGSDVSGDALLRPSTLAGATLGNGTKASFSYRGGDLQYSGDGEVSTLDLQRIGQQFNIAALKANRFKSNVNGRFTVSGAGTKVADMRLDASGNLVNSTLMGIDTPQATFRATIANGALQTQASGQFRDLNPATVTGNASLKGNLAGGFDVNLGLANLGAPSGSTSILDDVSLGGRVNIQSSNLAGVRIDAANFDGSYANRYADVRQLTVTGPDLQLKASGLVTFTDQGQSALKYELTTPVLDRIGKLVDKPLEGAVTMNGQLSGNAGNLRTTGTLQGSNVGYAGSQALGMTSQYDVEVPNLDASRAAVRATTTATFLKAAGLEINEITARTAYANNSLDFDTTIRQPKRSLRAAGNLLLHADHQEVHLRDLMFQSGGMSWQIAPGTEPAIQYGNDTIALKDVRLVSGSQEVTANGTIAPKASNLRARLSNVSLADVDAMMLSNRQIGGLLNAEATITGPRDALNVAGQFSVNNGSFRQFTYQSLTGNVRYGHDTIGVDVRLQENPQAFVEARGTVPTALFSATAAAGAAGRAPVDLRVQSSAIDLGIIQGFTTAVEKATGTAQADVRVTGTAADPDADGAIDIRDGAFKVVPTGVSYKSLNSHIAMQGDHVGLQSFTVTDEHGKTLTMTGELSMRAREVGPFNAKVQGQDFEVIHNPLAQITLNPALTVSGDVRQPKIAGTLGINTGKISIDKVLDLATASAYSTTAQTVPVQEGGEPASQPIGQPVNQPAREAGKAPAMPGTPAEHAAADTQSAAAQAAPSGGMFDAAAIDLHITVPDDLVVKGSDIRVGQSSMGLGNVNLTIGGDIRVQKAPGSSIRLLGQVETVRGTYDFQGRRFDIQRGGTLRFEGLPTPNPALDITATRLISGVDTKVHVGGTVRRPDLTLTSNPPLDQADILSLIIFGQPSNQLGEGQQVSLAQRAGTIASGFVASKLAQSIGNALNLDTFEIQTGSDTGDSGATVTVGEQLSQRLYVKLRQGVGSDNTSEFVLDYQLTNFLRFESTMTQGSTLQRNIMQRPQQSGADLIFIFSF